MKKFKITITALQIVTAVGILAGISHNLVAQDLTASAEHIAPTVAKAGATSSVAGKFVSPKFPASAKFENVNQFISRNLEYPEAAVVSGTSGMVRVNLEIDKAGYITNYTFVESPMKEFEAAVEKVIKTMPRWIPASHDGVAISSTYELRMKFRLQ